MTNEAQGKVPSLITKELVLHDEWAALPAWWKPPLHDGIATAIFIRFDLNKKVVEV
jgi:hypothetical protein